MGLHQKGLQFNFLYFIRQYLLKTVLITGATSGIGFACVEKFSHAGYRILAVGRSLGILNNLPDKIPGLTHDSYVPLELDLSDTHRISELEADLVNSNVHVIDALINSAGIAYRSVIDDMTLSEWDEVMRVNVSAPFFLAQALLSRLRLSDYPSIVNVSSIAGRSKSLSLGCHYTTSKAALIGMTRHLATELSPFGIRVNCTAPSQTHSPMLDAALSPEQQIALAARNPMNRLAGSGEQADVIYYLCSPQSSYINGAIIDVNGGIL